MFERIRTAVAAVSLSRHLRTMLPSALAILLLCAATAGAAILQPPAPPVPPVARTLPAGESAEMVPAHLSQPSLSLLPFLQVYVDTTGEMDVEEVAALAPDKNFAPLDVKRLPRVTGVTWLRFVLDAAAPGQENSAILLDMGESVPGTPTLYNPLFDTLSNSVEWRENTPTSRNVLLLPRAGADAQICFLRLDGLPGLWFSPTLRTPHNAATDLSGLASKSALVALAVVMLLCLLRGLSEHGQWRIWTALYVAAALVQGYFGIPGNGAGYFSLEDTAALLTPGLALMFLPHVGRHLMQTRGRHRFLDAQFILLVLPGAALALLPLVPDMAWTARYLPLWPAGSLLCVPTATAACLMGLPGARRFLLGILLQSAAVAASVLGLDSGYAPGVLDSLPLWGTALSALLITATAVPRREEEEDEEEAPIDLTMPAVSQGVSLADDGPLSMGTPQRSDQLPLLEDPHLRLLPSSEEGIALPRLDEEMPEPVATPVPPRTETPPAPSARPAADPLDAERLEEALRRPLDDLMRESAVLDQCSLPPSARETARNMTTAARQMLAVLRDPASVLPGVSAPALQETFDLQELMRSVHDSVAAAAENSGIALAWYMPPYLPSFYSGEYQALDAVLRELLESAVRATRQGAVHFSVRRVPDSDDPGHLLFTVQDSGSGTPPAERSSLALSHAWELAGRSNGFLSAECGIRGATIAFTLHLEPVEGAAEAPTAPSAAHAGRSARRARILVCTPGAMDRQALVHMLDGLSCVVLQARTLPEALALHEQRPVTMLIASGSQVSVKAQETLERFRQRATAAHLPVFGAIAVTGDDSQWDALAAAGFTHALLEPVDREALRQTVREILEAFFGSQGAEEAASSEAAAGHPAGFPPLSGLLASPSRGREEAQPGEPAPEAAAEAAPASEDVAAVSSAGQATLPETGEEPAAAPAESVEDARPALDNRWGETAPAVETASGATQAATVTDTPETAPAEDLPVIDNQWGAAPAASPAAEELPDLDNQWGRTVPTTFMAREEATPAAAEEAAPPVEATVQEAPAPYAEEILLPEAPAASAASAAPSVTELAVTEQPSEAEADLPSPAGESASQAQAENLPPLEDAAETAAAPAAAVAPETKAASADTVTPDEAAADAAEDDGALATGDAGEGAAAPLAATPSASAGISPQVTPSPASGEFLEWVGEPTPIPSSRPKAEGIRKPAAQAAAETSAPAGAAQPVTLTMQEALRAAEQGQLPGAQKAAPQPQARQTSAVLDLPTPSEGAAEENGAGVPSFLRRVLGRLQGQSESTSTPSGPQSGRARAADARRRAALAARTGGQAPSAPATSGTPAAAPAAAGSAAAPVSAPSVERPVAVTTPAAPAAQTYTPPVAPDPAPAPAPSAAPAAGSGAAADQEMLDLVARFDAAVRKAQQAFANGNCLTVAVAAESIARDADAYGFRSLGRMARCVEQAGRHEDLGALRDLLPDLVAQVERNRIAIQKELR